MRVKGESEGEARCHTARLRQVSHCTRANAAERTERLALVTAVALEDGQLHLGEGGSEGEGEGEGEAVGEG